MQHPEFNDPNIILKPPLWVHDPDQTYDFFYINRMTDFFLLNPDFYHQFPIDLISTNYKSYGCYIMFDRATYDNYPWCENYDVIFYNRFKKFSGSDAYRTFDFLPDNLKIEKPSLIFPDDFNINSPNTDLLLTIPSGKKPIVFTWLNKHTYTQFAREQICDKICRIIYPKNTNILFKLPCSEMLYGSLVISCEDSNILNQIKAQFVNGYQWFLYENLNTLLNIFDNKIAAYYGNDLHKIPKTVNFKHFYGYKITTGIYRRHDEYYLSQNPNDFVNFLNKNISDHPFMDLTSSPEWSEQTILNLLLNYDYDVDLINNANTFYGHKWINLFTFGSFNDSTFSVVNEIGTTYETNYPRGGNILNYPNANSSPVFYMQYYNTIFPLMLNVTWELVPNWYQESCLIFCYPISEKLAQFRIPESQDLSSGLIYYDGWWFNFLPPLKGFPSIKRNFLGIDYPLTLQNSDLAFAPCCRLFSHKNVSMPSFFIFPDNGDFFENGTSRNPSFANQMPNGWFVDSGFNSTFQLASTPYNSGFGVNYRTGGNDYANIQYRQKYLCYGIRGNFRLAITKYIGYTPLVQNEERLIDANKFRLRLFQWNWDSLIFNAQGECDDTWQVNQNNFTDNIIWEKTLLPFDVSGIAEEIHEEIPGTLVLSNIKNFSDLQIDYNEIKTDLEFYNNWKDYIMANPEELKRLVAAVLGSGGEGAYFLDENGDSVATKMPIVRKLDLMAKMMGVNFDSSGKFQKMPNAVEFKASATKPLPKGWYEERAGINRGFLPNGQPNPDLADISLEEQLPGLIYKSKINRFVTKNGKRVAIEQGGYYLCSNLIQRLELMLDDFAIALDLQNLGAGTVTIGNKTLEYEGLTRLIHEIIAITADTNQTTEQGKLAVFINQQLIKELLKALGLPCEIKQFTYLLPKGTSEVTVNGVKVDTDKGQVPYTGIAEGAPTLYTLYTNLLTNIAINTISNLNLKDGSIINENIANQVKKEEFLKVYSDNDQEETNVFQNIINNFLTEIQKITKGKELKELQDLPTNNDEETLT